MDRQLRISQRIANATRRVEMAKHVLDLMPHENGKETSGSAAVLHSWKISRATRASVQCAPLGLTLGFYISFYVSSTGRLAILQLLSSQARKKKLEELLNRK